MFKVFNTSTRYLVLYWSTEVQIHRFSNRVGIPGTGLQQYSSRLVTMLNVTYNLYREYWRVRLSRGAKHADDDQGRGGPSKSPKHHPPNNSSHIFRNRRYLVQTIMQQTKGPGTPQNLQRYRDSLLSQRTGDPNKG